MNPHFFTLFIGLLAGSFLAAQNHHPYRDFGGEDVPILTLSQGRYNEFFDTDTLEIIGSAILNTNTMRVVGFVEPDTTQEVIDPTVVSRWLSIDPLAHKYPSMSPYNFVGNSPVIHIDPDGRDIKYFVKKSNDGSKTLFVTVNAKMLNHSSQKNSYSDMAALKSSIEGKAKSTFSGIYSNHLGEDIKVNFTLNIEVIFDESKIGANDHVINLVNDVTGNAPDPIGKAILDGNISAAETKGTNSKVTHTAVHEFGHNLGLFDEYEVKGGEIVDDGGDNLMGLGTSYKLTNTQRAIMFTPLINDATGKVQIIRNMSSNNNGNSRLENIDFIEDETK